MDWQDRDLYLIFTPARCAGDPWKTLDESLRAGVNLVQWRAASSQAGLDRCLAACADHAVPLLVNDAVNQAAACPGIAGAHIGQDDMAPALARATLRADQVLGVSSHNLRQAEQAIAEGGDHLGIGPCFPTRTKAYTSGLPEATLATVLESVTVPTFAIGGITAERIGTLRQLGCRRVAVSHAILGAERPGRAVEQLLESLRQ